jgi:hypothetical protein
VHFELHSETSHIKVVAEGRGVRVKFLRMSRSIRRVRTARRSRVTSSRSLVVSAPGRPRPAGAVNGYQPRRKCRRFRKWMCRGALREAGEKRGQGLAEHSNEDASGASKTRFRRAARPVKVRDATTTYATTQSKGFRESQTRRGFR